MQRVHLLVRTLVLLPLAASTLANPRQPVLLESPPTLENTSEPRSHVAGGDTTWLADWTFDAPGGCDESGWSHSDGRILNDGMHHWTVDASFAGTGGISGNAAVLREHDLTWAQDGYGNLWDESIVLRYQGPGATLSFRFRSDTDPSADFVTVEADSLGLSEARVNYAVAPSLTPAKLRRLLFSTSGPNPNGAVTNLALPTFGLPGATHEVYIRFSSNENRSDEDGGYLSSIRAGLVVDAIAVTGGLAYTEDFSCGAPACLNPNLEFHDTAPSASFGDWARLYNHPTDNDKCSENTTCAWIFSDAARPAFFPDMAFGPGGAVLRNWLDDILVSPWVNLSAASSGDATLLTFRRFPGSSFSKGKIVQGWRVRSTVRIDNSDTPTPGDSIDAVTPWGHTASYNTLSNFTWGTTVVDITNWVPQAAREIQVSFRTTDFQLLGDTPPATLDPGPGPYLDRVRIGRRPGPQFDFASGGFLAQDGFPTVLVNAPCTIPGPPYSYHPTTDRFGTGDFSQAQPWESFSGNIVCLERIDSLGFVIRDARGAGMADVSFYGAIVSGPHAGKAPPPWSVGPNGFFRVPVHPGTVWGSGSGWDVDLDDEYFRGGDVLDYLFTATDAMGGFASYPPGLAAEPSSMGQASAATGGLLEVSWLPTIDWDPGYLARIAADPSGKLDPTPQEIANSHQRACILYVDQTTQEPRAGVANRTPFLRTLDRLGYTGLCDVYHMIGHGDVTPSPLASRATVPQTSGYALIVHELGPAFHPPWLAGSHDYPQMQWYRDYLAQASSGLAGRSTLWLMGNHFVSGVPGSNALFTDMGVALAGSSQPPGVNPDVVGQASFTWADGSATDFTGDLFALSGAGCPTSFGYDGLNATGTAAVTHRYDSGGVPGAAAGVANENSALGWNSLLTSFAWGDVRDPLGGAPGAQEDDLLASILNAVLPEGCRSQAVATGVGQGTSGLPIATRLHASFPNPANPVASIEFDLAKNGIVRLRVYDVAGRLVRSLYSGPMQAGWRHRVTWNGLDQTGAAVASGLYLYRLETTDFAATRKLILLR